MLVAKVFDASLSSSVFLQSNQFIFTIARVVESPLGSCCDDPEGGVGGGTSPLVLFRGSSFWSDGFAHLLFSRSAPFLGVETHVCGFSARLFSACFVEVFFGSSGCVPIASELFVMILGCVIGCGGSLIPAVALSLFGTWFSPGPPPLSRRVAVYEEMLQSADAVVVG